MSEKRHKINKVGNFENIIVINNPHLRPPLKTALVYDIVRMISRKISRQDFTGEKIISD